MGELLQFISDVYACLRCEENTEARHPNQFEHGTTVVDSEPPRSWRSMASSSPISGPGDVPTEVAPPSTDTNDAASSIAERVLSDVVHITVELRDGDGDATVHIQAVSMGLGEERANTCDDVKARSTPGCQVSYSLTRTPGGRCLHISLRPAHEEEDEQHSHHHLNLGHSIRRTELSGVGIAENAAITEASSNTVGTPTALDPDSTGIQDFDQTLDSVVPMQCVGSLRSRRRKRRQGFRFSIKRRNR